MFSPPSLQRPEISRTARPLDHIQTGVLTPTFDVDIPSARIAATCIDRHHDALAAEARRLQQQADTERRVELLAYRNSQEQAQEQPSVGQYQRHQQQPSVGLQQQQQHQQQQMSAYRHPTIEEDSESRSDWEPGEADDADTVYIWERFDDRGRPLELPTAQQHENTPDEALLTTRLLTSFKPTVPQSVPVL